MPNQHTACILLGSNIQPAANIRKALWLLREHGSIIRISTTWETPPVGTSGPNFFNTAVLFRTPRSVDQLKDDVLRQIEADLGRVRTADKYSPRTIDLDIILYDERVVDPAVWTRPHITIPVAEVAPDITIKNGETIAETAKRMIASSGMYPHPELLRADEI